MLKRILIGFAGFVFLGVVLVAFFLFYDTPAPDTRSFVFSKTPDNEAHAARVKVLNECFPEQAFKSFLDKHPHGRDLYKCAAEDWDYAAVAGLLEQAGRNGLWQALDDMLQAPPPPPINNDPSLGGLSRIYLAMLLEIKARDEVLRGHPVEALRTAFKIMELGRKWAGAGGDITSWLGSLEVREIALRTVAATIAASPLPDEALREALARVPASRPDARETAWVIRGETAMVLKIWSDNEAGLKGGWFGSLAYKPNLSKRRYLDRMTRMLSLAGCDEAALDASDIDQGIEDGRPKWTKYNPYNQIGRLISDMMQVSVAGCFRRDMELHSMTSAIEALLAIRLYGSAHGRRPPPSLEALVPDFLPEVPRDGFDGTAIRYSVEERMVWFPGRLKSTPPFVRSEDEKEGRWNWEEYRNVFFLDPPPPAAPLSSSSAGTSTAPP